jgi:hypothetical protein
VCAGNLLVNPDFEGGSRKTESEGTSLSSAVSDGWSPWFVRGGENVNREPEFKVEQVAIGGDPYRIRSGSQSMKWFVTWATHDAGIYQRAAAPRGANMTFSAYAMAYTGEEDGWNPELQTFLSDPEKPGNYALMVGIDPTGAVPAGVGAAPPPTVVWSAPSLAVDNWVHLEVSAPAQANAVTVYLRGNPYWAVKHNDSFWEDACLTAGGYRAAPAAASSDEAADQDEEDEASVEEAGDDDVEVEVKVSTGTSRTFLPGIRPHNRFSRPIPE